MSLPNLQIFRDDWHLELDSCLCCGWHQCHSGICSQENVLRSKSLLQQIESQNLIGNLETVLSNDCFVHLFNLQWCYWALINYHKSFFFHVYSIVTRHRQGCSVYDDEAPRAPYNWPVADIDLLWAAFHALHQHLFMLKWIKKLRRRESKEQLIATWKKGNCAPCIVVCRMVVWSKHQSLTLSTPKQRAEISTQRSCSLTHNFLLHKLAVKLLVRKRNKANKNPRINF